MAALAVIAVGVEAGGVSPRDGGMMPDTFLRIIREHKSAYTLGNRWVQNRRFPSCAMAGSRSSFLFSGVSSMGSPSAVAGTINIPVVSGIYSDFSGTAQSLEALQKRLFDGPQMPGTMSEYYSEVSFGLLEVSGMVYDWVGLLHPEVYYTGPVNHGLTPGVSRTDEMIAEIVDGLDNSVDFGLYDNDGPDGIPNSGDDDGYVDILVVVHPARGGECGGIDHMWSHSWQYSLWDEDNHQPLVTDDPATGGGSILIDDYIIAPTVSCDGGLIEIGVFCHEFGHALGLPDLYDYNGGGSGIGYWGLMGNGNWNTPDSPAHMCAWSREQLGWVQPVEIGWGEQKINLESIAKSGDVLKLVLPTKRFRRMPNIFPATGFSLICAYTETEAGARGWSGGAGYGNGWNESMIRSFYTDGSSPCFFEYDIGVDIEPGYDNVYLLLLTGNDSGVMATYTASVGPVREVVNLSDYLPGGECEFTLKFLFVSDFNFSDEDGRYNSIEGWALNIDNIVISGGGIDYTCDFEEDSGGWRQVSQPAEYFLVENRRRFGFDSHLPGQGLLIWHAENSIAYSDLGNSGGYSNVQARGLVLQEADGNFDLIASLYPLNKGDAGDPYPGSSGNSSFTTSTTPSSRGNDGIATPVSITGISSSSAYYLAGMPAPYISSIDPDSIDKAESEAFVLDISGANIQYGATCSISRGHVNVFSTSIDWLGENRIQAFFNSGEIYAGSWDVIVTSGDGQEASIPGGLMVESVFEGATVSEGRSSIEVSWSVDGLAGVRGCMLHRKGGGTGFVPVRFDTLREASGVFRVDDAGVIPGTGYLYRITAYFGSSSEELFLPGPWSIEEHSFSIDGSYPNPFNESVTVSFFVPRPLTVEADIFDVAGRHVTSLGRNAYLRGTHTVEWQPGTEVAPGVFFCLIRAGNSKRSIKIVLLR